MSAPQMKGTAGSLAFLPLEEEAASDVESNWGSMAHLPERLSTTFLPAMAADSLSSAAQLEASERAAALSVAQVHACQSAESAAREIRRHRHGLALYAGATLALSLLLISYKLAVQAGTDIRVVILFRCSTNLVIGLSVCAWRGISPLGHRRTGLLIRGVMGCTGIILQVIASALLPTAIVSVIGVGLQPVATAVAALLMLGEAIPAVLCLSLPCSLLGICLIIEPWSTLEVGYSPLGLAAAAGAPCAIATSSSILRRIMSDQEGPREVAEVSKQASVKGRSTGSWRRARVDGATLPRHPSCPQFVLVHIMFTVWIPPSLPSSLGCACLRHVHGHAHLWPGLRA